MTKQESERREHMFRALATMGLSRREAEALRRISLQLHSWHERLRNEDIEERAGGRAVRRDAPCLRDGFRFCGYSCQCPGPHAYLIPNRGAGAERRLAAIMAPHRRRLCYYVQRNPRGAALYIVSHSQLRRVHRKPAELDCCYSMGTAVY